MPEKIRVLIADDQDLVRGALAALLNTEDDIEVVATVGTGQEVLPAVEKHHVDVALLDIEMPDGDGLETAQKLTDSGCSARSLIVTTFGRTGYLTRALSAGASGFIVKDTPPAQLAEAIRRVHRGLRVVDPQLAEEALYTANNPLTTREIEICHVAKNAERLQEVASALHLSTGTIRNHFSSIMGKTNTTSWHTATKTAEDNGWL